MVHFIAFENIFCCIIYYIYIKNYFKFLQNFFTTKQTTTTVPSTTRRTTQKPLTLSILSTLPSNQNTSPPAAPINVNASSTVRPNSTTQFISNTELQNVISSEATLTDLLSSADSNDILDKNVEKPKRYTISAAKSAGMYCIEKLPNLPHCSLVYLIYSRY